MRSLLRWLAAVPIGVAFSASGCNQISGVNDYEKTELRVVRPCTVNADCAPEGDDFICRKDTLTCVKLTSEDCSISPGADFLNDEAFIFASLLPLTNGEQEGAGAPLRNAMRLAVTDITDTTTGLPPRVVGLPPRPVVMLECNDQGKLDVAKRAAAHVADVGLPAILGPMFSGIMSTVTLEVTINAGIYVNSPTASAPGITDLPDGGLVWRMAPSAKYQVGSLASLMTIVEADATIRGQLRLTAPQDPVKVATVFKGDAFGNGLADGVRDQLSFNGVKATVNSNAGLFTEHRYVNPDNPALPAPEDDYNRVVDELVQQHPHFVILLGVEEINTDILPRLEARWDTQYPRPYYLSAPGPYAQSLFNFVANDGAATGVRTRMLGIVPGTNNEVFSKFRSKYGGTYDAREADTSGPSHSYDSVYLLAYGAVAVGDAPITGTALAQSMSRLTSGVKIDSGPGQLTTAYGELGRNGNIDFNGASGPLSFDLMTGDSNISDMQFWCISQDNRGKYSDVFFSSNNALIFTATAQATSAMGVIRANCGF
jgi:ABC-type branched-subunit amino acid transport system substrate-binding protein